jgi:hypothetical protein
VKARVFTACLSAHARNGECYEEISAACGENAAVFFRIGIVRDPKMIVVALTQTPSRRREAVSLFAFNGGEITRLLLITEMVC